MAGLVKAVEASSANAAQPADAVPVRGELIS